MQTSGIFILKSILFISFLSAVLATCWSNYAYHIAAKAFAEGVGDIVSNSVCRYGNDTRLNSICNPSCEALMIATWGDCYCLEQNYVPGVSNNFVANLTVLQIFELLATPKYYPAANCRDFLNQTTTKQAWTCSGKIKISN